MGAIKAQIEAIRTTPDAVALLNGDLLNWATKASISDCYAERYTPMEEMQLAADLLSPIRDKIIGATPGNHERRAYRAEGVDVTQLVCKELGIADRYSRESLVVFLRLGRDASSRNHNRPVCYTLYANHGSGGGRREGGKANRLADMASIVDADIYIHSHTHMPMIMRQAYYRTCQSNSSVQRADRLYINTAATLDYGGYGELAEYKPSSTKSPIILLSGTCKHAEAVL